MRRQRISQQGFTIIELMIATAVFSVVLLLCTFAVLSIGRTYYKGVITTRTQETTRAVMEEITDAIRFGGAGVVSLISHDSVEGFCIGNSQFTYRLGVQLVASNQVLKRQIPCAGEASKDIIERTGNDIDELLRLRMRLDKLEVKPVPGSAGVYKVVVRVIHGEDDLLTGDPGEQVCIQQRAGSEYCAVSELSTIVERRT